MIVSPEVAHELPERTGGVAVVEAGTNRTLEELLSELGVSPSC
jgi:hypothetical protein